MQGDSSSSKPITAFNINPPSPLEQISDLTTEKSKQERTQQQLMEELITSQYDNYAGQYIDRQELASYMHREGRPVITDSLLDEPWIKQTLQEAFYSPQLFNKHGARLRKSEKFFEFVLGKLMGRNKNLEFLWRKKREMLEAIYEVEPPLTEEQCRQLQAKLGKYRNEEIMYQLALLGVSERMCQIISQISENNLTRAVQIALQGNIQSHKFEVPTFQRPQDECIFLHQWLNSPQRRLLLLRLASEEELDIFTRSLKHRCLGLFQMFLRHRRYIQRAIHTSLKERRGDK